MQFYVGPFEMPPDHVPPGIGNSSCQFKVYFQALLLSQNFPFEIFQIQFPDKSSWVRSEKMKYSEFVQEQVNTH